MARELETHPIQVVGDETENDADEGFFVTSDIPKSQLERLKTSQEWNILTQMGHCTKTLSMSGCNVCEVPSQLLSLTQLTRLYLTYNNLKDLPPAFGKLVNLQILNLGFNIFVEIPTVIFGLTNLQVLFLKNNRLTSGGIGYGIKSLSNLEELYLSNNDINSFPESLCGMSTMQMLILDDNAITSIPESIPGMTNLKVLKMRSNRLKAIPMAFTKMRSLEIACFSQNMIESFPFDQVNDMPSLRDLCVYANRLRDRDALLRCMGHMTERGGLIRAQENRVVLRNMGGVCDSPFRIWKFDILWLHDGELTAQCWISNMCMKLQNRGMATKEYGPLDPVLQWTNHVRRSRVVAVYCTRRMCQLLCETCTEGAQLRGAMERYFGDTPVTSSKERVFWLVVERDADLSHFFIAHGRHQNTLLIGQTDIFDELVKVIEARDRLM